MLEPYRGKHVNRAMAERMAQAARAKRLSHSVRSAREHQRVVRWPRVDRFLSMNGPQGAPDHGRTISSPHGHAEQEQRRLRIARGFRAVPVGTSGDGRKAFARPAP